jgi:hypothetical protein
MSLLKSEPTTKLEKWLSRIAIIALALWEMFQKLIELGAQ